MTEPTASANPNDEVQPGTPQSAEDTCPQCQGRGLIDGRTCPGCSGSGTVVVNVGDA